MLRAFGPVDACRGAERIRIPQCMHEVSDEIAVSLCFRFHRKDITVHG